MLSKDELRAMLQHQVSSYLEVEPDAIKLYAPEPLPERKPWRKRPTSHDLVFAQVIKETKDVRTCSGADSAQSVG